jgi:hypothetical protein
MVKVRAVPTVLVTLTLAAVPCDAHAAGAPPGVLTSDTTLKIGQTGVLKLDGFDEHYKPRRSPVGVQVSKIEQGKPSDLNGKGLPVAAKGMVPRYIHSLFSYTNAAYQGSPPPFSGEFADDSNATALIRSENIGPCPYVDNVKLSQQQKTVAACDVVLAPPGVKVVGAFIFVTTDAKRSIEVTWR